MNLLDIHGIDKHYPGQVKALDDLTLSARQGELLALVGESGCGKTTLLRVIAGLEQPDAGKVVLNGRVMTGPSTFIPPEKRGIGLLFQDYALFPHLSVADNVQFGLKGWKTEQKKERIRELLALCGIEQYAKRFPHELSGGQQQRAALARALAPRPGLVLLDEPFSNIDSLVKEQVRSDLQHLFKQSGVTAIFVTHDLADAFAIADRVAVMRSGKLEQLDTPNGIYNQPQSPYVAHFLGHCNLIPGTPSASGYDTPLGPVKAPAGPNGFLLYRPQHLTLLKGGGTAGKVESVHYLGHAQEIGVRVGLQLYWVQTSPDMRLKKGDQVLLGLKEKPVHVVPKGATTETG